MNANVVAKPPALVDPPVGLPRSGLASRLGRATFVYGPHEQGGGMHRSVLGLAVAVMLSGTSVFAGAMDVREVGVRLDLTLQPVYAGDAVHWDFDLGGYCLFALGPAWDVRASAGFDVLSAGPYLGIGLVRILSPSLAVEADSLIQWSFGSPTPVATVGVGARLAGGAEGLTYQVAAFPANWTLASVAGMPATFSFSPSVTVGGGIALATGLEFGEAITVKFMPAPPGVRAVLPMGGWVLSTRLTSLLGFAVAPMP